MFAEFGSVPLFYVSERCSGVSVFSFEVVFCESDVCFRLWLGTLLMFIKWASVLLSAVAILLSFTFVLFAMSSMCWGEFKTRLL